MSNITSRHYGVTISLKKESYPTCCGANILRELSVSGTDTAIAELTTERKFKMYQDMMVDILAGSPGLLIAADCVINYGEWADLSRSTSQWKQSAGAGDISLENFCEYFEFNRSGVAKNKNSGNLVACFSLATNAAMEDDSVEPMVVDRPDFSDDEVPDVSMDVKAIVDQINALLAA